LSGRTAALARRFVAHREHGVVFLAYVRPPAGGDTAHIRERVERALHPIDPSIALTGYPLIEADVRAALRSDVARVGGIAGTLVALLLIVALRRLRPVLLALAGLAVEILALAVFLGISGVRLDAYNLLALPVLMGITIDEIVFVLHAYDEAEGTPRERAARAVRSMASATTATAASTAAGFMALASCQFEALRGLGVVAGVGTFMGLLCAVVVVPAFARIFSPTRPMEKSSVAEKDLPSG
jgi:uncharacterized protein